ncbi:MAG: exodeoxyribonuclease VII large subunit [Clostridiales bacterium]|nr:exodeoxyribonuclease VII large subunit [Clostridiales bacterium]
MTNERTLSVTEAMSVAKRALESITLTVIGEVSEFSDKPGYKATYFTVCDAGASMSCLMWQDAYRASGITLRCGMLVELTGQFSAYLPKGRMQFVARRIALAGEGHLRMRVAELTRRLDSEGLMSVVRKRQLPALPERIAVVTSPRGKAVHDVIRTLKRRYPLAEVLVAGVPIEGVEAASCICEGLATAVRADVDVVLLVRGGGSYEDLMPFNDETVARAIVACPVPVVTGIGHEPDTTIADLVADLRASTPTAAAEAVVPSCEELESMLGAVSRQLARALERKVRDVAHRVRLLADRPVFREPVALLGSAMQAVDQAEASLARAIPIRMERDADRLRYAREGLFRIGPRLIDRAGEDIGRNASRLHDLSPLAILGRGYAVVFGPDEVTVIRSAAEVAPGDVVRVRVREGRLRCIVDSTEEGTLS